MSNANTAAPGHTDLMVTPESLDAWLAENPLPGRATKAEVMARLDEAHVALVSAADAMARRYGSTLQVDQLCGAASMITGDWMPRIQAEIESDA